MKPSPDFVFDTSADSLTYSSNEGTVRTAHRPFVSYAPVSKGHIASGGSNNLFGTALTEPCSGSHRYAPLCGQGNIHHRALSIGYSFGIPLPLVPDTCGSGIVKGRSHLSENIFEIGITVAL